MENDIWVLEWSKRQCAFHIQPLAEAVLKNAKNFAVNDAPSDYVIIGVGSRQTVDAAAAKGRPILQQRDKQRLGWRVA